MTRKHIPRVLSGGAIILYIVLIPLCTVPCAQAWEGKLLTYTISGSAGTSGVTMKGLPNGPIITDANGNYSVTVDYGWKGTVTPEKEGYTFQPPSIAYSKVTSNQTNQDYAATLITFTISGTVGIPGAVMNGLPSNPVTSEDGSYTATVGYGFSGAVTPKKEGYTFEPPERTYQPIKADQTNQNYQAKVITFTISGTAGMAEVIMTGLPGDPLTDQSGAYSAIVKYGWHGTVTPTKEGYTFNPPKRDYTDLATSQTNQDYTGTLINLTISGTAGKGAVTMNGLPGNPVTDANGYYKATVQYGWNGTVKPTKGGYTFEPPETTYSRVTSDMRNQSYIPTLIKLTIAGSTGIDGVVMNGLPGNPVTSDGGKYSVTVDYGFSGNVGPTKEGYVFTPPNRRYEPVTTDLMNQDYSAAVITFAISGTAQVSGVLMDGLPSSVITGPDGTYTATVEYGWDGRVTPTKAGYTFEPAFRQYADLIQAQTNQHYKATLLRHTISGTVSSDKGPIEGALVSADHGGGSSKTDANGQYTLTVDYSWSGTIKPSKEGYTFNPASKRYDPVTKDQTYQGYAAALMTFTIVDHITIGGEPIEGVSVVASDDGGSAITGPDGKYTLTVPYGWSGTVTPSKEGYEFNPPSKTYTNVKRNIIEGEPEKPKPSPPITTEQPTVEPKKQIEPVTTKPGADEYDAQKRALEEQIRALRTRLEQISGQVVGPNVPAEKPAVKKPTEEPPEVAPKAIVGADVVTDEPRITAVFLETDLRQALQEIASQAGTDIYVDDTVKGKVTLRLINVPLSQALETVLKEGGYKAKKIPHSFLVYTPISNTFVEQDLRTALQDIASMAGVTIVPDETVTGLVTCELKEVPLETALEIVLAGTNYVIKKTPHYYLVCSGDPKSKAFPGVSETHRLKMNYIDGDDAIALLSGAFTDYVKADANSVLVTAPPVLAKRIIADLRKIDQPPRHVMLEARVVVMEQGDLLNLGIEWGWPKIAAGTFSDAGQHGLGADDRLAGVTKAAWPWGVQIGYTADKVFTDSLLLTLNLLAENSEANIVANPQVLAQDGRPAQIKVMTEEYYMMTAATAEFLYYTRAELEKVESGTSLSITPRIGDNNDITLEIAVEVSDSIPSGRGSDLPVVTRRTASNTVRVKDGGTVALAGLTENKMRLSRKRVPGLSGLPLLGALFRNEDKDESTRDVAVFITAHLIPEATQAIQMPAPSAELPTVEPTMQSEFGTSLQQSLSRPTGPARMEPTGQEFESSLRRSLSRPTR
jgi:type II secretory pathway component GspD/PulD (secretin)